MAAADNSIDGGVSRNIMLDGDVRLKKLCGTKNQPP